MVVVGDGTRIFIFKNCAHTVFYGLKSLPVTACGKSIDVFAIFLMDGRIPVATTYPLDQIDADAVSFKRKLDAGRSDIREATCQISFGSND